MVPNELVRASKCETAQCSRSIIILFALLGTMFSFITLSTPHRFFSCQAPRCAMSVAPTIPETIRPRVPKDCHVLLIGLPLQREKRLVGPEHLASTWPVVVSVGQKIMKCHEKKRFTLETLKTRAAQVNAGKSPKNDVKTARNVRLAGYC